MTKKSHKRSLSSSSTGSCSSNQEGGWLKPPPYDFEPASPRSPFSSYSSYSQVCSPAYSDSSEATVPSLDYYSGQYNYTSVARSPCPDITKTPVMGSFSETPTFVPTADRKDNLEELELDVVQALLEDLMTRSRYDLEQLRLGW